TPWWGDVATTVPSGATKSTVPFTSGIGKSPIFLDVLLAAADTRSDQPPSSTRNPYFRRASDNVAAIREFSAASPHLASPFTASPGPTAGSPATAPSGIVTGTISPMPTLAHRRPSHVRPASFR